MGPEQVKEDCHYVCLSGGPRALNGNGNIKISLPPSFFTIILLNIFLSTAQGDYDLSGADTMVVGD